MSNTCNLECAMCNGDWSSTIRSRREGRPPLPKVYDDRFFDELTTFLPHLDSARFAGGEPFVAAESLRILDMLADQGSPIECTVQTNGTQWNPRVERILDDLAMSLIVSVDGVTRQTVERIRAGASYDALMANLERFRRYTEHHGTGLHLAFCFMVQNWHEFGDFLLFADDLGATVSVVTVVHPSFSPYHLPPEDFTAMLRALEGRDGEMRDRLGHNRPQWVSVLRGLRTWYDRRDPGTEEGRRGGAVALDPPARRTYVSSGPLPEEHRVPGTGPAADPRTVLAETAAGLEVEEAATARCDADGKVVTLGVDDLTPADGFLGIPARDCIDRPWDELAGRLGRLHGPEVALIREVLTPLGLRRDVALGRPGLGASYLQMVTYPEHHDGEFTGSVTAACRSTTAPDWAPGGARPATESVSTPPATGSGSPV